jgi:hypothetical protein
VIRSKWLRLCTRVATGRAFKALSWTFFAPSSDLRLKYNEEAYIPNRATGSDLLQGLTPERQLFSAHYSPASSSRVTRDAQPADLGIPNRLPLPDINPPSKDSVSPSREAGQRGLHHQRMSVQTVRTHRDKRAVGATH